MIALFFLYGSKIKDQKLNFWLVPLSQFFAIANCKLLSTGIKFGSMNGDITWQLLNHGC